MSPTRRSTLEVEDALLTAGTQLGMKTLLLRMVAANLPDAPWVSDLEYEPATRTARASHLCGAACPADATSCLTAFKVEDAVTKRTGEVLLVQTVEREGPQSIRVHLRPME